MATITTSFIETNVPNTPGNDFAVLLVGTFPVDDAKGKSKTLHQCISSPDYNSAFGSMTEYWDNTKGVTASRSDGWSGNVFAEAYLAKASNLYIYNVIDPTTHKSDVTAEDANFLTLSGDTASAITSISLSGVPHPQDLDVTYYWNLVTVTSTGTAVMTLTLYSDSAKTTKVCEGDDSTAAGTITLAEENSSGVTGTVAITPASATDNDSSNTIVCTLTVTLDYPLVITGSTSIEPDGGGAPITAGFTFDYGAGTLTRTTSVACTAYDVDYSYIDNSKVTAADVATAIGTAKEQIYVKYGKKFNKIHAPVYNTESAVREALKNASFYNGCFYASSVYDIDVDNTTWTADMTAASLIADKTYTDYTMDVGFNNDASGSELLMSDLIILQYAVNAKNRNGVPSQPISGNAIDGYDPTYGEEYNLNYTKCNTISEKGITTACRLGDNWVLWGDNRTADTVTSVYYKKYQTAREMRFYLANFLVEETFKQLQKSNITLPVLRSIIETANGIGKKLVNNTDLAGMTVYILPEENPVTDIANGKIKFRIKDCAYPALLEAEFVFETDLSYLSSVLPQTT